MPSVFVRGDQLISEDEFTAHLAQAARVENIAVLLGAGSSLAPGGKTIAQLWNDFRDEHEDSAQYLVDNNFVDVAEQDNGEGNDAQNLANVEAVMDRLTIAELDLERQQNENELTELQLHKNNLLRSIIEAAMLDESLMQDPSSSINFPGLEHHRRLLSRLVATRQPGQAAPWVFSLNYDLAIEQAAEALDIHIVNGFGGLHSRKFTPSNFELGFRNVNARGEARFGAYNIYLAKLHGSLSWALSGHTVEERQIRSLYGSISAFVNGTTNESPGVLIYPGSAKFIETSGFIYGEMMRRMTEFLARSNVCLLVNGYGFGDFHVNRVLLSALQNPTLQLVLYVPKLRTTNGAEDDQGHPIQIDASDAHPVIDQLIKRSLPQVTFCGGSPRAYFDSFALDLPEPAIVDTQNETFQELLEIASTQNRHVPDGDRNPNG